MTEASTSPRRHVGPLWGILGWTVAILMVGALYLLWTLASDSFGRVVPAPEFVFAKLADLLESDRFWKATGGTLIGWLPGFLLGGLLGLAVGIVGGRFRIMASFFGPALLIVMAFPIPLTATLLMTWEGLDGYFGRVLCAALMTFVVVAAALIVARKDRWDADFWRSLCRGLAVAAILALGVVLFVEMFSGREKLGTMLSLAVTTFDMGQVFAIGIAAWILGILVAAPFLLAGWLIALIARWADRAQPDGSR